MRPASCPCSDPRLDARGERPSIYIGTSVGAVNATYQAAAAHLPAPEEAAGGIDRWRQVQKNTIIRPILLRQAPLTAIRYIGEIMSLPGVRLPSLLDPKPFERNLDSWINWEDLHRNVESETVGVVGTVATAARTGRTRRVRRGPPRAGDAQIARDRLRPDPAGRAPRARVRLRSRSCFRPCAWTSRAMRAGGTSTAAPG